MSATAGHQNLVYMTSVLTTGDASGTYGKRTESSTTLATLSDLSLPSSPVFSLCGTTIWMLALWACQSLMPVRDSSIFILYASANCSVIH